MLDQNYWQQQPSRSNFLQKLRETNYRLYQGVLGMSSDAESVLDEPLVCDFCGFEIEEIGQDCPALDEGVCRP